MGIRNSNSPDIFPSVEIHIEELVLRGFAASDRLRIGAAIERELSRLIAQQGMQGLPIAPIALDRVDAGSFQLAVSASPQTVGRNVAQRVYRQLSPTGMSPSQIKLKGVQSEP